MLLYILWLNGLVLSTFINIPMSFLAYMRYRLKDKEFYNYLKNRSLKDKILFNIKNAVRFLLPIYNIIYPIKLLLSGPKSVSETWKEEILTAKKNKGKLGRSVKGFFEKVKSEIEEFKDEFFPSKNKEKVKENNKPVVTEKKKEETKKATVVETSKPVTTTVKKQPPVPAKKEVSGTKELTPERIDFYLTQYRKDYDRLKKEYETLKANKAPVSELNKVVRNMNALALRSQQLMDIRKGMIQEKTESSAQMKLRR